MRVITGKYGGRRFNPPDNIPTRPTTDFAKTGLFNILNNHIDFAEVAYLDLFAGTGSLCYEFASRGCANITAVERDSKCVNFIRKTILEWRIQGMEVMQADVLGFIPGCKKKFDIIFAGPPYALVQIPALPEMIFQYELLNANGWFVLETSPEHSFASHPKFFHVRNYGDTHFHFFRNGN